MGPLVSPMLAGKEVLKTSPLATQPALRLDIYYTRLSMLLVSVTFSFQLTKEWKNPGAVHEHMRPDRDHFVTINFENIDENAYPGATKNFELVSSSTHSVMNTPFDTSSIMMYGPHDFAKNDTTGKPLITLQPKEAGVDIR